MEITAYLGILELPVSAILCTIGDEGFESDSPVGVVS